LSLSAFREKLKEKLESVPGIGVVHDYQRWTRDREQFKTLFVKSGKLNAWWVEWPDTPEADPGELGNTVVRTYHFVVRGVYALKDSAASDKEFDLLVEKVLNELSENRDLDGTVQVAQPALLGANTEEMFSEVLSHICSIDVYWSELIDLDDC